MTILEQSHVEVEGGNSTISFCSSSKRQTDEYRNDHSSSGVRYDVEEGTGSNDDAVRWCWKENKSTVKMHPPHMIHRDTVSLKTFVLYEKDVSEEIEKAWKLGAKEHYVSTASPTRAGSMLYRLDFESMKQVNEQTGYSRRIKRIPVKQLNIDSSNDGAKANLTLFQHNDPKDIPAYTCTCREHCRYVPTQQKGNTAEEPVSTRSNKTSNEEHTFPAACTRRHFCTKCRRYAHGRCLTNSSTLCYDCREVEETETKTCRQIPWSAVALCPLYLVWFSVATAVGVVLSYLFFPPFMIYTALFVYPEKRKNQMEYLEDGVILTGIVTRKWTYEVKVEDGTRTEHMCSIAYSFPEEHGIYRLDYTKTHSFDDALWSELEEGSLIQLVGLRGLAASARIRGTIRPWTSMGLLVRCTCTVLLSLCMMLFMPILVYVSSQPSPSSYQSYDTPTYLETNPWMSSLCFSFLGCHFMGTLILCLKPFVCRDDNSKMRERHRSSLSRIHIINHHDGYVLADAAKAGDLSLTKRQSYNRATVE